jgi:hypothetical protein
MQEVFFINRSSKLFGYIADFLRGDVDSVSLGELSPSKRQVVYLVLSCLVVLSALCLFYLSCFVLSCLVSCCVVLSGLVWGCCVELSV